MSCNPELVSAFIDGELESVIIGAVTTHLLECDDCCRTMSRLALVQGAVSEKFALCHPEDLTRSVMSAISNEKITPPKSRLHKRLVRFGVPAILVASLLSVPGLISEAEAVDSATTEIIQPVWDVDSE